MPEAAGPAGRQEGGLLDSLKALVRSVLALAQARLELLGNEVAEQRVLFLREVLLTVLAAFFIVLGVVFAALFVILIAPLEYRPHVVGLFALMFFIAVGALYAVLRAVLREQQHAFSTTIQELGKDRESLR
jgi:uncharacterized membrane protein YqjE